MPHIVATARPAPVAAPAKTLLGKYVVVQFDSDPAGTGVLTQYLMKLTGYTQPEPTFVERKTYNTTTKLMEVDTSIATEVDATEIELESSEPRDSGILALINSKIAYIEAAIWVGDPRDAANKCAMSSNRFGATLSSTFTPSSDEYSTVKIKLKVTSPAITWSADTTLT